MQLKLKLFSVTTTAKNGVQGRRILSQCHEGESETEKKSSLTCESRLVGNGSYVRPVSSGITPIT